MAQNDFLCLTLSEHSYEPKPDACPLVSPLASELTCSGDDDYVPVNFISDEVRAMIKAWHWSELKRRELKAASVSQSMNPVSAKSSAVNQDLFEPMRSIPNAAPPKRFYRRFWGGIARRVLEHERNAVLEAIKATSK